MAEKRTFDNALPKLIKESILEDIMKGKIGVGDKLVEAEYSQLFGTSRAPVREAFYLLSLEGIVKKIPRKGTTVRGFSRDEMSDILKIRNFLEQISIDKLTLKARENCTQKMSEIISEMEKKEVEIREYAQLNFEFHFQLILASGSETFQNIYSRLGSPLISLQTFSLMGEDDVVKNSLKEHKEIVKYLSLGEIEKSKSILNSHNEAVFPRIKGSLKD
ncbi:MULTISPECIES: GntR family transcriptional regulator [unclassified Bacillus (in: firmicutes)]|uniref:GntR family transcriptional regulator n=1 Tax=unclassified Bacillus (in: firmicutes) TaxID=185979 RepID=UPI001BE4F95D|nr:MULTISPECIES: GntR family transcriptional regulator [unclassified Bacillus (in: firmicutes)]MBT2617234.1 GntR family transcriptional regulator [Bacillus sp. ISL-78]MBT2627831.1 GntR family transcriptional regulator [Bacillus sp. ISL-101]